MTFFATGLSHKSAPVELREQLAVQPAQLVDTAEMLKCVGHLDEIVLLSTCNRVEIYGTTQRANANVESLLPLLCSEPRDLDANTYLYENADAARHLLRVTAGLDSMMIGETGITGQIKSAYEIARAGGLTGSVLNRVFQKSFQATKEIRTSTGVGRGAVSIESAAVELLERRFGNDLAQKCFIIIGAGEMAERCLQTLVAKGVRAIFVSNRSFDRATDLASRYGGEAVCFGYGLFEMRDSDVVIAGTSSAEVLLDREDIENLMKARHDRPLLLIDLSVPRNIDPGTAGLSNVTLYDIDHLEVVAREGVRNRGRQLTACQDIIDRHVAALMEKLHLEGEPFDRADRSSPFHRPFVVPKKSFSELVAVADFAVEPGWER